jgi:2-dehydro-3-deoxyphosphogluconate aldolase/(4S)-4-hydroxy-2-oxoglutarate aldolase
MSSTDPIAAVLEVFAQERCSAILRTPHAAAVAPAMQAAVDGGLRIVEFTLTTPGALEHIAAFARQPGVLVGAGTVLDVDAAASAVDAGARFLVSPVADPEVIGWAVERGIVAIPGVATPTEMLRAHRAGAPILKLFPAPASGPDFVRAVLAPLPFLRIFPTNGVDAGNAAAYLAAGAFGVGFVAALFPPAELAAGRFESIRERARALRAAVRGITDR